MYSKGKRIYEKNHIILINNLLGVENLFIKWDQKHGKDL